MEQFELLNNETGEWKPIDNGTAYSLLQATFGAVTPGLCDLLAGYQVRTDGGILRAKAD